MRLPFVILTLLILVPLAELAVIIKVGGLIGVLPTIALLVGMAVLGTVLLRLQGLAVLRRTEKAMTAGEVPIQSALDGIGLLVAGALMLTPGFLTDIVAVALLVPTVRRWVARWVLARVSVVGTVRSQGHRRKRWQQPGSTPRGQGDKVIEGEFTRVDEP
ncbi:MAG: FxsA family protein [Hyphomicrobiaceae bacterium]